MSESELKSAYEAKKAKLFRWGAWSSVALSALLIPIAEPLGAQAVTQELSRIRPHIPSPEQLHLNLPDSASEGQSFQVFLGWQNLPAGAKVEPTELSLQWEDTDYSGKKIQSEKKLNISTFHQRAQITFQSPGAHKLEIKGPDGSLWHSQTLETKPFQASVFPQNWEQHQDLIAAKGDPKRFHLWVNLHFDPKNPKQRQYLQITFDDQILERLLVSSGAVGHATPQGQYEVGFKDFYPRSAKYNNTPMPFWSSINMNGNQGEYGFHSLEDGGYLYLLGRPASHGCIRLSRKPSLETNPTTGEQFWGDRGGARWIYERVPEKTPVTIFKQALPQFAYQDYQGFLVKQAKAASSKS